MMENDNVAGLLSLLKDLLSDGESDRISGHLERLSGNISQQVGSLRDQYSRDNLLSKELSSGPVGFPWVVTERSGMGVLEWCATQGVWGGKAQAEAFVGRVGRAGRLNKGTAKRLIKDWVAKASGEPRDPASVLTFMVMDPAMREELTEELTMGKAWLTGFVGNCIRTGQRWTGNRENTTLQEFIEAYQDWQPPEHEHPVYWPVELWPFETAEEDRPLQQALINYLYQTLLVARDWENLSLKARNGVLLSAYGVAAMLGSTVVLMPFAAVNPELAERLHITQLTYEGLCDVQGRPSALLHHTLKLAHLVYGDQPPGELALKLVSPISRQLDDLLTNADKLRGDLRAYRMLYLKRAHAQVEEYIHEAQLRAESLPEPCLGEVRAARENLAQWETLTGLKDSDETPKDPVARDYWQRHYLSVADGIRKSDRGSFSAWLNANMQEVTGESLDDLQVKMSEAMARMDTERLTELVGLVDMQKSALSEAVSEYLRPITITPHLTANVPVSTGAGEGSVTASEIEALRRRVRELELEMQQQGELLGLSDAEVERLSADLEQAQAELRNEQQRSESLSHQLNSKRSGTEAKVDDALFRAMGEGATLQDALEALGALYPDTAVVLDSAFRGIRGCGYKNVRKVIDNLMRLCGPYYNAVMHEGVGDVKAREILGSSYKAQESDTTLASTKMRGQREFYYEGEKVLFEQHLTLGIKRGDQSCIQIYFKIIDGLMVIGYVGPHLDTAST